MIRAFNAAIDGVTMYRLVLYYLAALVGAAFLLGFFGLVPVNPTEIAFSLVLVTATCAASNWLFGKVFRVPANIESAYITALIIVLIMPPTGAANLAGVGALVAASAWAIAGKFILAIRSRHLFNPAALGVALTALLLDQSATWWAGGNLMLLPIVLVGGLLVARKLQRFDMIGSFILFNLVAVVATAFPGSELETLSQTLTHSPLFFFAFIMLTEPLTAPQARWPRIAFGALVGVLSAPNVNVGGVYFTPELALLVGNLFAFLINPKARFALTLLRIEKAAAGAYDFVFSADRPLKFSPGQYMEWTLGLRHADNRGNRRHFTIASAPGAPEVRLGVKFAPDSSSFKRGLAAMRPGDRIFASPPAGSFVLPKKPQTKLAFIAGGIGITPFRSMLEHLLDQQQARPVVVLYGNARVADIAYKDVLDRAEAELGIPTYYAAEEPTDIEGLHQGFIDARMIGAAVPDYRERTFYISGPHPMVNAIRKALRRLGVSPFRIKVDFFPGLA